MFDLTDLCCFLQRYDPTRDKAYRFDASMELRSGDAATPTLEQCLLLFLQREQLGADNPWYCSRCQKHQQAYKKFDIYRAPPVRRFVCWFFNNICNYRFLLCT